MNESNDHGQPTVGDDSRLIWLASYRSPVVRSDIWDAGVGDFVRSQISRLDTDLDTTKRYAAVLAKLADWCFRQGIALDVESVLDPDTCNRFSDYGVGLTDATLSTYRSDLRRIGPLLTKHAPWAPRPKPRRRSILSPPYSEYELALVKRDAGNQRTLVSSLQTRAIVAVGLGAGIDGRWSWKLRGSDIARDQYGVVLRVPKPRPRSVYVRTEYADELCELFELAGNGQLLGAGHERDRPNRVARAAVIDQGRLALNALRLRSTWIVAHLNAGTHIRVLMAAAGVRTFDAMKDLIRYVDDVDADLAAEMLTWP